MPPKKRNVQLESARCEKKLKKENNSDKSNSSINKSIFSNKESFDFVPEIEEDDKTIQGSDNENELSDLQLSDSDSDDDNWNNEALDDAIRDLDTSIFEKMLQNSKKKDAFISNRPLIYVGNSERTTRRKKAQNYKAAENTTKLTNFFEKKRDNNISENMIQVREYDNNLNESDIDAYKKAVLRLNLILEDKNLSNDLKKRGSIIKQYLNLRLAGIKTMDASLMLSKSVGGGEYHSRLVRNWSKEFIKSGIITVSSRGKHPKIKSLLWHEDVNKMLKEYLLNQKSNVEIKKVKSFIESEVFSRIGIEEEKTISERTCQIWLNELGWFHQKHRKDVYYDGHEREDVVKYREKFLSQMQEYERFMPKPSENDIMIIVEPSLGPGEKRYILVVHDESIFYSNDGKKTFWGPKGHMPLKKKGNGLSLHISEFLTEIDGRLKFENEEACVVMKPGVNREGWWTSELLIKQVKKCTCLLIFKFLKEISC